MSHCSYSLEVVSRHTPMWLLHVLGSGVWVNVGRMLHLPGARQLEAEGNMCRTAQKVV